MTSNIGSEEFNNEAAKIGFSTSESDEAKIITEYAQIRERVLKQLPDFFAPEFLNRIDKTVVFSPLDKKILRSIIVLQLDELVSRLRGIGLTCTYDTKAITYILSKTYNPEYGARPVRRYIQDSIEDVIADMLVAKRSKKIVHLSSLKGELHFTWKA